MSRCPGSPPQGFRRGYAAARFNSACEEGLYLLLSDPAQIFMAPLVIMPADGQRFIFNRPTRIQDALLEVLKPF
jgi:hypothetical protein